MIRRPPRYTLRPSSAASDVYKRQPPPPPPPLPTTTTRHEQQQNKNNNSSPYFSSVCCSCFLVVCVVVVVVVCGVVTGLLYSGSFLSTPCNASLYLTCESKPLSQVGYCDTTLFNGPPARGKVQTKSVKPLAIGVASYNTGKFSSS